MSRLRDGTLSRPSAGVCLTEANHRGGVEAKLGQAALAWIWDQRGDLTYPDDNDLVYAIVDLLVREGQEEDVWRWMQCESPRSKELPEFVRCGILCRDTLPRGAERVVYSESLAKIKEWLNVLHTTSISTPNMVPSQFFHLPQAEPNYVRKCLKAIEDMISAEQSNDRPLKRAWMAFGCLAEDCPSPQSE